MTFALGIDVQGNRPHAWVLLDPTGRPVDGGRATTAALRARSWPGSLAVGIDAPRRALDAPRSWYWDGKARQFRPRRPGEVGAGRHAEVVIKALGLGNPQWTPLGEAPGWMREGFALFAHFAPKAPTWEVFPTATALACERAGEPLSLELRPDLLGPGRKDGLDAHLAAWTAWRLVRGLGWEVGADGLGTVGLPVRLADCTNHPVLTWPG